MPDQDKKSTTSGWSFAGALQWAEEKLGIAKHAAPPPYVPPPPGVKVPGQVYDTEHGGEQITTPHSVYSVSIPYSAPAISSGYSPASGEAHFGTDFSVDKRLGLKTVGTFISATAMGNYGDIVNVGKDDRRARFDDHETATKLRNAIHEYIADKVITTLDESKANYMVEDILDDHKLNGSAPNNPNKPARARS